MKIAITGAGGLLGKELVRHFSLAGLDVTALERGDFDIADQSAVQRAIGALRPNILINCAAIVAVEQCQANPALAQAVNRDGAGWLMQSLHALPAPGIFVQISSAVVFGGWEDGTFKIEGYAESDQRRPNNVYERSKKEAEDLILSLALRLADGLHRWYIVRTSILYGEGRRTLVDEFAETIRSGRELVLTPDRWSSPTWTRDLAAGLATHLASDPPSGIYHLANAVAPGEATMLDISAEIGRHACRTPKLKLVPRKDFFTIPRSPSNVLRSTKIPSLRPWRDALREYLTLRYHQAPA